MRFDDQVVYPYPVLRQDTYDYKSAEFFDDTRYVPSASDGPLAIAAGYTLDNPALQALVAEGKAMVGLLVECREALLQKVFHIAPKGTVISLDPFRIHGKISLRTVIHSVQDIESFTSPDFADDFAEVEFDIPAGSLLGFCPPRHLYVEREAFGAADSVIEIQQSDQCKHEDIWDLDTEKDRLSILVSKKMMGEISSLRQQAKGRQLLMGTLYMSVVQQAVELLKKDGSEELLWQRVFRQRCTLDNVDLAALDSSKIAQFLLRAPLKPIFETTEDFNDED